MKTRPFGTLAAALTALLLWLALSMGCGRTKEVTISGKTMGTTYQIKLVTGYFSRLGDLKERIKERLSEINQSMSTYMSDSEISRFNALEHTGKPFAVSRDMWNVLRTARKVFEVTGGAWDGTVRPLVELWGFSRAKAITEIPSETRIEEAMRRIGFQHIRFDENRRLNKGIRGVSLDLASIAKGYGVDQLAALLDAEGFTDFLIEIGGEVYASGLRKDGRMWQVGINTPKIDAPLDQVYKVISLKIRALATSGNYRNFFQVNGVRYSHILDPRTGRPADNSVVSVSVVASDCTLADGLATGILVMGPETGLAMVDRMPSVEALIVTEDESGKLGNFFSRGFQAHQN